ncbi:MAG TPA: CHAT domain-containing tetratricopeptide repeat protein [Rhodocyclaceae bacterium]|nr:CHAT domain-containing tetratricopeptide repeat protein [Rhodocyclaceae bacterium]
MCRKKVIVACVLALLAGAALAQTGTPDSAAAPVPAVVAPPPPTIADLVLLLKSYKPNPDKVRQLRDAMDKPIAADGDGASLALAWHQRAMAAEELGESAVWLASLEKGLAYARQSNASGDPNEAGSYRRLRNDYALALRSVRGLGAGLDSYEGFVKEMDRGGWLIPPYHHIAMFYTALGDMDNAKAAIDKAEELARNLNGRNVGYFRANWMCFVERARGHWYYRQGNFDEAERAFLASIRMGQEEVRNNELRRKVGLYAQPKERVENSVDVSRHWLGLTYISLQRLDEAEVLLREVLKASLARNGLDARVTGITLTDLSLVFTNRGRFAEALVLSEWSDKALAAAGLSPISMERLHARKVLANAYVAAGRPADAVTLFDDIRKTAATDQRLEEDDYSGATLNSVRAYMAVGRLADAQRDADALLKDETRLYGPDHYYTAEVRAYRAAVLHRRAQLPEARKEFERAVAVLVDPSKVVGKQQTSMARTTRLRLILGEYLNVLVGGAHVNADTEEAFRVADVARWQSVQKAVAGSALRAAAGTPELGVKIKQVQDADEELEAVYKNLIAQRSAPPEKQLPKVIAAMESRITTLKQQQQRDLTDIRRQFPQYDDLVNPRPASIATARKALRSNEALLSVYVTPAGTYSWATASNGELQFHYSPKGKAWVAEQVKRLRAAVDLASAPEVNAMHFDLEAASALYQELLSPVDSAWANADTLLVVANESLGQIPFSLLPTAPTPEGKPENGVALSQYRATPWLARKVAVAYLPSVSALVTLRALPFGHAERAPFLGFGDPDFGSHAAGASSRGIKLAARGTRNLVVSHALTWDENATNADAPPPTSATGWPDVQLASLPDTRDEIIAIATALAADPKKDAYFGTQANVQNVMSADLKHRRIVAFATHGLVAGDLPGLDQPALALSPRPGKDLGDGLLKLDDVLKLSMDADLVVLSACNTAAADGSGSEAVSGLGRGFFYAGARAVLATHWPVETVSARQLVSHLFEHFSQDGKLTRAQALRQAMLQLIDKEVAVDAKGRPVMAYAHPAFWAPYALYGDPGR